MSCRFFVMTNWFRTEGQYSNGSVIPLANPPDNTLDFGEAALFGRKPIYRCGYLYKKTGVMQLNLAPAGQEQTSLFYPLEELAKYLDALMSVLDWLNRKFDRDTLCVAAEGTRKRWAAKAENETLLYHEVE